MALTGAGISVPSGIPDFRTPGEGLWEKVDPMEVAHIDAFRSDPARFWGFYRPRLRGLGGVEPNPAHEALAELERRGLLEGVITQNIDMLHTKAGSERVIEVHGSIRSASCQVCSASFGLEQVDELFDEDGVAICSAVPGARQAGRGAVRRVPAGRRHGRGGGPRDAGRAAPLRRLLARGLPGGRPSVGDDGRGGRVAIVTQGPTPYDGDAAVRLGGDVTAELSAVLAALS